MKIDKEKSSKVFWDFIDDCGTAFVAAALGLVFACLILGRSDLASVDEVPLFLLIIAIFVAWINLLVETIGVFTGAVSKKISKKKENADPA